MQLIHIGIYSGKGAWFAFGCFCGRRPGALRLMILAEGMNGWYKWYDTYEAVYCIPKMAGPPYTPYPGGLWYSDF